MIDYTAMLAMRNLTTTQSGRNDSENNATRERARKSESSESSKSDNHLQDFAVSMGNKSDRGQQLTPDALKEPSLDLHKLNK
jgi:hypothetical protein